MLINIVCKEGADSPTTYHIQALDPAYAADGYAPHGYLFYSLDWPDQDLLVNFCLNNTSIMPFYTKSGCIHATYEIGTCLPLDYPKTCEKTQCFECPN